MADGSIPLKTIPDLTPASLPLGGDEQVWINQGGGDRRAAARDVAALSYGIQGPNLVFAGPVSGNAGPAAFRPLVGGDLPLPTTNSLGGVEALLPVPHRFLTGIDANGQTTAAQPDYSDLTGLPPLVGAPGPPGPTNLGGLYSKPAVPHQWLNAINVDGTVGAAQPAAADLSNGTVGNGPVVLQTSPALVTPDIGAATGASVGLSGYGALPGTTYSYAGGTPGAPAPVGSGNWVGWSGYNGWDGQQFTGLVQLAGVATNVVGPNNIGGQFIIRVRTPGAGGAFAAAASFNADQSTTLYGPLNGTGFNGSSLAIAVGGSVGTIPATIYKPALATGQNEALSVGAAATTYNSANFGFTNVGGAGSAANLATLGLYGATNYVTIDGAGNVSIPGVETLGQVPVWPSFAQGRVWASPAAAAGPPSMRKLAGTDLPPPAAASLGGVMSLAAVANQFLTSIGVSGQPVAAQPSTQSLSDRVAYTAITPTLVLQTPGDGVFSAVTASGGYARIGMLIWFWVNVRFTLTYTTAANSFQIQGLPNQFGGPGYCQYAVTPLPGAPADHLLGVVSGLNLLGEINGNNYMGNFFGPGLYGLVSGTQYTIHAGGVYLGAG